MPRIRQLDETDDGQEEVEDDLDLDRPEEGLGVEEEKMLEQPARGHMPFRRIDQQGEVVEGDQPCDPLHQEAGQAPGEEGVCVLGQRREQQEAAEDEEKPDATSTEGRRSPLRVGDEHHQRGDRPDAIEILVERPVAPGEGILPGATNDAGLA